MDEMLIPLGITDAWIEAVDLKIRHLIGHLTFGLKVLKADFAAAYLGAGTLSNISSIKTVY